MHGDAAGRLVERGEQATDFDIAPAQYVQGPRAVFAGAPGEQNFFTILVRYAVCTATRSERATRSEGATVRLNHACRPNSATE